MSTKDDNEEPTYLDPAKVGAAVVKCPGCGEERWYGYGACGRCGTYLPSEEKPAITGDDALRLLREREEWLRG